MVAVAVVGVVVVVVVGSPCGGMHVHGHEGGRHLELTCLCILLQLHIPWCCLLSFADTCIIVTA